MLKDIINKYSEPVVVPTRLNVVDVLTSESAVTELNNSLRDMGVISKEIDILVSKQDDLTNESGLVSFLYKEGYGELTNESAVEVAKDVWVKIKKAIKILVDKFLLYFNKAKLYFAEFFNNNEAKIKALIEILKRNGNQPDDKLLDNESFGKRIPMFKNFHEKDSYLELLKTLTESYKNLFMIDNHSYNKISILLQLRLEDSRALLKLDSESITTLVLEQHGDYKLKIETKNIKSEYKDSNKIVMKKESLISILESCLKYNNENLKKLDSLNSTIEKLNNISPSEDRKSVFSIKNAEQNVSTSIRAIHMYLENSNKIFKDILYILTQHVKAYNSNSNDVGSDVTPKTLLK